MQLGLPSVFRDHKSHLYFTKHVESTVHQTLGNSDGNCDRVSTSRPGGCGESAGTGLTNYIGLTTYGP